MNTFKIFPLCIVMTIAVIQFTYADWRNPLDENIPITASIGIFHSGPVIEGSSQVFAIHIQAEDKTIIEQLRNTPEWWKYVKVFCQVNKLKDFKKSIYVPQLYNARDATKLWKFVPALENPMEAAPTEEKDHILSQKLVAAPTSTLPFPQAMYSFFAILDTREAAKTDESIPSLYVPQMGVCIFQIHDKSALTNPHDHQNYIADQITASLLKGDFKKAEEWIPQYAEAGGDPVIAAEFHLKVLLYQHKFEEAFEQYQKMAELDSKYLKENPKAEAYVLPGMVQEFREKIDAAIAREKTTAEKEKQ